jgi:hypothetical protein
MKSIISSLLISGAAAAAVVPRDGLFGWEGPCDNDGTPQFDHVAIFSVDGLHASDIDKWVAKGPSTISEMLEHGYLYSDAYTTFPSGISIFSSFV